MNNNQVQEQVMQAQSLAVDIEEALCEIFECKRFGFGGQVNSDKIRKHPYLSMTQGLAYLYAIDIQKRANIEKFISDFSFYSDFSLDMLLSFDTNEKLINGVTIQLQKENGLEEVKYIIDEFNKVIK